MRLLRMSPPSLKILRFSLAVGRPTASLRARKTPQTPSLTRSPSTCGGRCLRGSLSHVRIRKRLPLASAARTPGGKSLGGIPDARGPDPRTMQKSAAERDALRRAADRGDQLRADLTRGPWPRRAASSCWTRKLARFWAAGVCCGCACPVLGACDGIELGGAVTPLMEGAPTL